MKNNRHVLFSGVTKMADVILRDYGLLILLPRFDIKLGFGERSVSEVCVRHNINEHLFLMVCNIHTFDDYFPCKDDLIGVDIDSMLSYLKRSHDYYINTRISSIESRLTAMSGLGNGYNYKIIGKFFAEYKQEVLKHFDYEDSCVFPNIIALTKGETVDFKIDQYEENHDNIDDKLSDLKNIIIKYLPEDYATEQRNDILTDIFLFEEDLTKHTRIEDKVLIPYVREIERGGGAE